MTRDEIKNILPHREPMLLLDEVNREGDLAVGVYHVKGDEWFLQGHFPNQPVVPGVILCEIMAQSTCVLMQEQMTEGKLPVYTGMNKVKFRAMVKPGDTLVTKCRLTRARHPFYFAEGSGYVGDKLCVQGEMSFALT